MPKSAYLNLNTPSLAYLCFNAILIPNPNVFRDGNFQKRIIHPQFIIQPYSRITTTYKYVWMKDQCWLFFGGNVLHQDRQCDHKHFKITREETGGTKTQSTYWDGPSGYYSTSPSQHQTKRRTTPTLPHRWDTVIWRSGNWTLLTNWRSMPWPNLPQQGDARFPIAYTYIVLWGSSGVKLQTN